MCLYCYDWNDLRNPLVIRGSIGKRKHFGTKRDMRVSNEAVRNNSENGEFLDKFVEEYWLLITQSLLLSLG